MRDWFLGQNSIILFFGQMGNLCRICHYISFIQATYLCKCFASVHETGFTPYTQRIEITGCILFRKAIDKSYIFMFLFHNLTFNQFVLSKVPYCRSPKHIVPFHRAYSVPRSLTCYVFFRKCFSFLYGTTSNNGFTCNVDIASF